MKPKKKINGITFFPVPEFDDADAAFGADERQFFSRHDLPNVPCKYEDMAQDLFFNGGAIPELHQSVDRVKELIALHAWLRSFAPAHEAKIATAGYALWLWTDPAALSDESVKHKDIMRGGEYGTEIPDDNHRR
jgi:hypothetical protein